MILAVCAILAGKSVVDYLECYGRNSGIRGWWHLLWGSKLVIMMIRVAKTTSGFAGEVLVSGWFWYVKRKH